MGRILFWLLLIAMLLPWAESVLALIYPSELPPKKTIGVVTVVPSKIHIYRWGYWDTACDWLDISDLHVDRAAFDGAFRALSPTYRMIRTTVDPEAVLRTRNTEIMGAFKSFPTIGEQVREIAHPEAPIDAYLLRWSRHSDNKCQLMPGAIGYGFGLTKSLSNPPNLHTFAEVFLIDAKTLQTISTKGMPALARLDNFEWKDTLAEMPPQQRQFIKTAIPQLVSRGVFVAAKELLMPNISR